jgi:Ca2+-binding RTX toxin-like protein
MSKRAILLLTTMLATLVVASGVALAATINCPNNGTCYGNTSSDILIGTDGYNIMYAKAGDDQLYGLGGFDTLYGEGGADLLHGDAAVDRLFGGPGNDTSVGGGDLDYYHFEANNWGKDTITDPDTTTDPNTHGVVVFSSDITANLTIDLCADCRVDVIHDVTLPEVTEAPGTSTVDWSGNVINEVSNESYGDDYVFGNEGANILRSYHGWDHVYGSGGDDSVYVVDGGADVVDCGAGYDTVSYDRPTRQSRGDKVTNCEIRNGER